MLTLPCCQEIEDFKSTLRAGGLVPVYVVTEPGDDRVVSHDLGSACIVRVRVRQLKVGGLYGFQPGMVRSRCDGQNVQGSPLVGAAVLLHGYPVGGIRNGMQVPHYLRVEGIRLASFPPQEIGRGGYRLIPRDFRSELKRFRQEGILCQNGRLHHDPQVKQTEDTQESGNHDAWR